MTQTKKGIIRRPIFWVLFVSIAIASIVFSFKYFSTAIPIVNIDITMDRREALRQAALLAKKFDLGPQEYSQAASFSVDQDVKLFVDLEGGGKKAFIQMIKDNLYMPYTWKVRNFKEREKNELCIVFTPEGKPYGFKEIISENVPGANIPPDQARKIAQSQATLHLLNHLRLSGPVEERIIHLCMKEKIRP